jgi:hypothetical protein
MSIFPKKNMMGKEEKVIRIKKASKQSLDAFELIFQDQVEAVLCLVHHLFQLSFEFVFQQPLIFHYTGRTMSSLLGTD